jgi:hypothetical protein
MARTGRPTSYDPAFIDKIDEYLAQCKDIEDEFHKTRGEKSDSYERLVRVKLPSRDGFSLFINVSRDSLHQWSKDYPDFSDALDDIDRAQKIALLDNGLSGTYNPTIAKLGLSANHGMREGTDLTSNGKEIKIGFDSAFQK